MKKIIHYFLRVLAMSTLMLACVGNVYAQSDDNPANCNELKDPDVQFQMDLCKAHVGCRLVMGIHNTCVKAKKFLNNIKEQVGEGVKSFFGTRKEVTSDMVFEASLDDKQRAVTQDKEWKDKVDAVKEGQKKAGKDVLTGQSTDGGTWTYIGDVRQGKENGTGAMFFSNGQIQRGEFKDGMQNGAIDMIQASGVRSTGTYLNNQMSGEGFRLYEGGGKYKGGFAENSRNGAGILEYSNGLRYEGNFKSGDYSGDGIIYRSDGTVMQRGVFEKSELSVGKKYDSNGAVLADVNKPLEEQKSREATQLAAAEKQKIADAEKAAAEQRRRQAELLQQQRQRDAKAAAEKAYRDSLAQMNAGQLFAKADELSSAGDSVKAREVLRALISRFPDHPLATTAAQQMSKLAEAAAPRPQPSAAPNNNSTDGNTSAGAGRGALQLSCNDSFDVYLNTLPNFRSAALRNVRQDTRTQTARHLADARAGRLKMSDIPAYRQLTQEYKTAEAQALDNHKKLSSSGVGPAMCNPDEGSQAMAWAATRMGIAFNTWVINVIQCTAGGQNNAQPIPAFCPY
jgi:hypothetical protein